VPDRTTAAGDRLAWLDAVRAVAALLVVGDHLGWYLLAPWRTALYGWFIPGYAGVCVFFLVSGYIIPASLERRGSLRDFWIGRGFRLYPLFLVAIGATLALHLAGRHDFAPFIIEHQAATALAQGSMLGALLGVPDPLAVTWTLAFEMAFYLLVSGLYAVRRVRASPLVALALAGAALAIGTLPVLWLARVVPHAEAGVAAFGAVVFAVAVGAMLAGRRRLATAGALLGAALAGLLLFTDQSGSHAQDGLILPALMFTGSTIYRAQQGEIRRVWTVLTPVAVAAATVIGPARRAAGTPLFSGAWHASLGTVAGVAAIFAAGFCLRHRGVPRALAWLGVVSYSVYLLHIPVLDVLLPLLRLHAAPSTAPMPVQALLFAVAVGAVLAVSAVSYRLVEAPAQRAGRRLIGRLGRPAARPVPQPRAATENRWPVSLTARTATPDSHKSTMDRPAGSR
jgi:peptidoglycan/LPS O-acetylase OafA/YrhL